MVHYAVTVEGKVVGSRSSKSHAQQITRTPSSSSASPRRWCCRMCGAPFGVVSYHSSERLALAARRTWSHLTARFGRSVAVTARRATVGDYIFAQGVL